MHLPIVPGTLTSQKSGENLQTPAGQGQRRLALFFKQTIIKTGRYTALIKNLNGVERARTAPNIIRRNFTSFLPETITINDATTVICQV